MLYVEEELITKSTIIQDIKLRNILFRKMILSYGFVKYRIYEYCCSKRISYEIFVKNSDNVEYVDGLFTSSSYIIICETEIYYLM